jgi:hypothetical protein
LLVIALCAGVASAEEPFKSSHLHKAEDPAKFQVGEEAAYSGPQPGEKLRGFTVVPPRRNHLEEEFDPVAAGLGKPHFMIFIDDSNIEEGIGAFINAAWMVDKKSKTGLAASVVILAHERTTEVRFNSMDDGFWNALNSVYRIGYAPDGRDGPGAYGLNRDFPMTIILADAEGKVIYNFPYREIPPDFPSPHVVGGMAGAVGEDRKTVAGWLNNIPGVWHEFYKNKQDVRNEDMKKKDMKNKEMKK